MALGYPSRANTYESQQFGPAKSNAAGYSSQPEMYGDEDRFAYWLSYKGWRWYPHYHNGLDVSGAAGTVLVAMETGKVVHSGWRDNGGGYVIEVEIRPGVLYAFAHCSKLLAKVGQIVKKGDPIAHIGMTGTATGNHVHVTVTIQETVGGATRTILCNPKLFLPGGAMQNDGRIKPAYAVPDEFVAFNAGVNGVNMRSAPDARQANVYAVAWADPKGIIRLQTGSKLGPTGGARRLYGVVKGTDGATYNEVRLGAARIWVQSQFMHRVSGTVTPPPPPPPPTGGLTQEDVLLNNTLKKAREIPQRVATIRAASTPRKVPGYGAGSAHGPALGSNQKRLVIGWVTGSILGTSTDWLAVRSNAYGVEFHHKQDVLKLT